MGGISLLPSNKMYYILFRVWYINIWPRLILKVNGQVVFLIKLAKQFSKTSPMSNCNWYASLKQQYCSCRFSSTLMALDMWSCSWNHCRHQSPSLCVLLSFIFCMLPDSKISQDIIIHTNIRNQLTPVSLFSESFILTFQGQTVELAIFKQNMGNKILYKSPA